MPGRVSVSSSDYALALTEAMTWLGRHEEAIFLGQAVGAPGTAMSNTLAHVPSEKKLELPVAEEMQLGMSIGLSLQGKVPVSIFPRWNFFILATNQLVNHLDKLPLLSSYRPKVIIRVGVGSERPMDPGPQHVGDFTDAFRLMLKTVDVARLEKAEDVMPAYRKAMQSEWSTILVEVSDLYNP